MLQMFRRIRRLWRLSATYDGDMVRLRADVQALAKNLNERTTVHADVHPLGGDNLVVVIGRYRGSDYVRAFSVQERALPELIEMLREMEPNARVGRFDLPIVPGFRVSAVYPHERL